MLEFVRFGMIDNGLLVILGLLGLSLERPIQRGLDWLLKNHPFYIVIRSPARFGLFCGGLANSISDAVGGIGIPGASIGTFLGCFIIIVFVTPFIFKINGR